MNIVRREKSVVIALTGGIACGKSKVGQYLSNHGAKVLDADDVAHELLEQGQDTYRKILDRFGTEILRSDMSINRTLLGRRIFHDEVERKALEGIMHPEICKRISGWIEKNAIGYAFLVVIIPLLFELGMEKESWDAIICVASRKEIALQRLIGRGHTIQESKERIAAQIPIEDKVSLSDFVIQNNGTLEELRDETMERFLEFKSLYWETV
ncbi:MAG: dephospho-CoA kinase [Methanomassiliicoccales archaeon]|jgi:dephospho-CoA kinase